MKNVFNFLILLFLGCITGCSNPDEDCSGLLCNSGPAIFELELVDSQTGENLFTNGTYSASDLRLAKVSGEAERGWSFIDENDRNLLQIATFEDISYSVKISGEEIFQIEIQAEGVTEDCCYYTEVNDFQITGSEFDQDNQTGIYKIFIDTSAE